MWGKKTISIFLLQRSTSLALLSTITQSMTGENSNEIINRLIQVSHGPAERKVEEIRLIRFVCCFYFNLLFLVID